mmetsp:Transcript_14556/g.23695  ORF Transcript_14556/g.23695 Transcript_14556/m.23695 type:complete len:124 (-) Transcript_14556:267-638(-)
MPRSQLVVESILDTVDLETSVRRFMQDHEGICETFLEERKVEDEYEHEKMQAFKVFQEYIEKELEDALDEHSIDCEEFLDLLSEYDFTDSILIVSAALSFEQFSILMRKEVKVSLTAQEDMLF